MIQTFAYDVEILPNFFSITFVDIKSYLEVFRNAQINGKPMPLVQVYSVEELKKKLSEIKIYQFYITDEDDKQLKPMIDFLISLRGNSSLRTDLFGYNSSKYDKLIIAGLFMYLNQYSSSKELIERLYTISKHIIQLQDNPLNKQKDDLLRSLYQYGLPFVDVDVMSIFALNRVTKGTDAAGNALFFPKSLKQTSINLQWYDLLEYELPPISDKDIAYYQTDIRYKSLSVDELNKIINKWDRYIIKEWIDSTMFYNLNDVFIVCEMIRLFIDEIRLRYNISKSYKVNVLSASRSKIADTLFTKFYSEFSNLREYQWRGKRTEHKKLPLKEVIFDSIQFQTPQMQEVLEEMKQVTLTSIGKKALKQIASKHPDFKYLKTNTQSGWFEVKIGNLVYIIATGGLHSKDIPRELKSSIKLINSSTGDLTWNNFTENSYVYIHFDISSFYPSLMDVYRIAPKHLNEGVFVRLIHWLKDTRIKAKHSKEKMINGIPKDVMAQVLKIVINSIYGKTSYSKGDLFDTMATLKVTINGQLLIMMLCESLELAGIEVISANTDGIVVKLFKNNKPLFDTIVEEWKHHTNLDGDAEEYECYINRDINNYIVRELNGKITYKGSFHPLMYLNDLSKGYDMPIVAKAVANYFLDNKPIMETLSEATNILDFCKSQNVGKQFHVELTNNNKQEILQRYVRFYVSMQGDILEKVHNETNHRNNLCAGHKVKVLNTLDDMDISLRGINYAYYYKEAMKIINPIKLSVSPNAKPNVKLYTSSGKTYLKNNFMDYNNLFDDNDN